MAIKLSGRRYEEIKKAVVNTFMKYDVSCIPVSSFEMAAKMGVKVVPYSAFDNSTRRLLYKESEDGFCTEREPGEWYIYYNDNQGYGRINNTIMHEIGHIVLDHSEDSELAEKEVKFFAKYALAPPVLVHRLKKITPSEISRVFHVSLEAATYAERYYEKWLLYGDREYMDYEIKLLHLFKIA